MKSKAKKYAPPFPWFGGKSSCADLVWPRLGNVKNYCEPFFGSGAMLFARPEEHFRGDQSVIETINDLDGYVANFWRAIAAVPDETARHADNPVNENDLHARHSWLVAQKESLVAKLEGDPDFFDAKIAGWWVWGICCWIGSGFCSGSGPWQVVEKDGFRQLVHLGSAGQGVNRKLVHLGNAGQGVNRKRDGLIDYFREIAARLRNVRVCCGDWQRICGPTPTFKQGLTGVFLDPPYADTAERAEVYAKDSMSVAHDVREWAIANGSNPLLRICLCGYEGEHVMPPEWECVPWKAKGGYASQGDGSNQNAKKERLWLSPHCLRIESAKEFDFTEK